MRRQKQIRIQLDTITRWQMSRSEARFALRGLKKFSLIILDYDKIDMIGPAFADEIYRVFRSANPNIVFREENVSPNVKFMIGRAKNKKLASVLIE